MISQDCTSGVYYTEYVFTRLKEKTPRNSFFYENILPFLDALKLLEAVITSILGIRRELPRIVRSSFTISMPCLNACCKGALESPSWNTAPKIDTYKCIPVTHKCRIQIIISKVPFKCAILMCKFQMIQYILTYENLRWHSDLRANTIMRNDEYDRNKSCTRIIIKFLHFIHLMLISIHQMSILSLVYLRFLTCFTHM